MPQLIQAPVSAPPPPWWVQPAPQVPTWLPSPALSVVGDATLTGLTPSATWDRISYDCCSGPTPRLWLGLQSDGLVVLPVPTPGNMNVPAAKQVPGTAGANGLVIAGGLGFAGDAAGMTGTAGITGQGITVLNMSTLTVMKIIPVARGVGVDNGVYDVLTKTVLMTLVNGSIAVLNSTNGNLLRTVNVLANPCASPAEPCDPLEFPVVDGHGSLWMNAADLNKVLKMSTQAMTAAPTMWDVSAFGCINPTGLDVDPIRRHLFIGCGNPAAPMLLILNADTGAQVTSLAIGRGNDGVVYDKAHNLIFAASGTVGTLAVIQQNIAGSVVSYAVREVQFTKVGARTLAVDSTSANGPYIYTMAADGLYDPRAPPNGDLAGGMFTPTTYVANDLDITAFGLAAGFILNAPPPPWYTPSTTPLPAWLSPVGLGLRGSTRVTGLSPKAQWDRLTWDPSNGGRLFLGLQEDGLVMLQMNSSLSMYWATGTTAQLVPGTPGCNGLVLAGGLGFAGDSSLMTGASGAGGDFGEGITVLNMNSMVPSLITHIPVYGGVGVDNGVYDPQHSQVIMTLVNGSIAVLSSTSGQLMSTINVVAACATPSEPCDPLEFPVVDGQGHLYMTAADQNSVYKLSTGNLAAAPTVWDVSNFGCINPTGLDIDSQRRHLFVACGNPANSIMIVLNADTGARVTSVPIGRGNDGIVYDPMHNLIFASAGTVGTLTVIQQNVAASPVAYAVRETQFTKVGARTMAVDYQSAGGPYIYLMAADGWYNPALAPIADFAGGVFSPNQFKTNSLTVMQYAPLTNMG